MPIISFLVNFAIRNPFGKGIFSLLYFVHSFFTSVCENSLYASTRRAVELMIAESFKKWSQKKGKQNKTTSVNNTGKKRRDKKRKGKEKKKLKKKTKEGIL